MTDDRPGGDPRTLPEDPLPEDPWPQSPYPPLELGPAGTRRRLPWWMVTVGLVTAVLALVSFVVVLVWPSGSENQGPDSGGLAFQPAEQVRQIGFGEATENAFTQVVGDRAYVAWQVGDDLELLATELGTEEDAWTSTLAGDSEFFWAGLLAGPAAVVAYAYPHEWDEEEPAPVPLTVLSAETGDRRWETEIREDDEVWLGGETLVLADRADHAVRGLRLDTGEQVWRVPFPGSEAGVVPVLSEGQLASPSLLWGVPAGPPLQQVVMVGEDYSARVIRVSDGEVVELGTNIARPGDLLLAYQDRLVVAYDYDGYRVDVRDLADLSTQPRSVYVTPDPRRRPAALSPCGADRVCLLDQRDGSETGELRAFDLAAPGGAPVWERDAPHAEWLLPAGKWILIGGWESRLVGYDGSGEKVLDQAQGAAIRISDTHLLLFATEPAAHAQDLSLAGLVAGGGRTELGQLTGVHGERCAWNETYLICPRDEDAGVWRFTDA